MCSSFWLVLSVEFSFGIQSFWTRDKCRLLTSQSVSQSASRSFSNHQACQVRRKNNNNNGSFLKQLPCRSIQWTNWSIEIFQPPQVSHTQTNSESKSESKTQYNVILWQSSLLSLCRTCDPICATVLSSSSLVVVVVVVVNVSGRLTKQSGQQCSCDRRPLATTSQGFTWAPIASLSLTKRLAISWCNLAQF